MSHKSKSRQEGGKIEGLWTARSVAGQLPRGQLHFG